ncbi:uncharacterized protein [Scyliorhinus torazame]|uniref:uncharacterized protein n=1 Tax=Scyliorhinus torazame TaxID=75743 RepID=UPI003B590D81
MASREQEESLSEDLICSICLDFFTDPVSLECGHNFCRSCITQCWEKKERNSCPECRQEFPERILRANRILVNLSEKARKLKLNGKEKESKLHCEEHQEELKLFCETDKKLICVNCVVSREHREHRFIPIKEAVEIYKDGVKSSFDSLTEKKSTVLEMEQQQKQKISQIRKQSVSLQSHITSEFTKMHQILTEKEQRFIRDLREEEEKILKTMEENLCEIQENLNSIQEKLSKLENQLEQKDGVRFLKVRDYISEEASRKRRISDEGKNLSLADGVLSIGKFNSPFPFPVWRGMLDVINPVSVTLDVETANPQLEVSEDLKSLRWTRTQRSLPDTRKRFTHWLCVLGSEGFTSGRHYWEMEVTGNRGWILGVAAESVERKDPVSLSPETGFWTIERFDDQFYINSSPGSRLPVDVQLLGDAGNDQRKELCSLHKEKVKLFCKTDNQLICVVCQSSKSHQTHGLLPLEEAAEEFKAKLRTFLKPVQEKKKDCNAVRSDYEKILNHIQDQGTNAEKQINAQFEKLHQFLREEERIVLEGLKLEKEEKSQEMEERIEKITEEISSLSTAVQDIEQELREQDNIKFLMVALYLFFFLCRFLDTMSEIMQRSRNIETESGLNQEVLSVNMASRQQEDSWTEDTICPICLDFFTDPVSLECGHNFCRSCITQCWEKERNSCPECRQEFPERILRANRILANLAEKARKLKLNGKEKENSREHREHRFIPIQKDVEIYKDLTLLFSDFLSQSLDGVKSSFDSLTEKKSTVLEMEQQQKQKISQIRKQSVSLQSHITSEFTKMHQILTEKEQRSLRDLREEEEKILKPMEENLCEIQENLISIQEKLSKLENQLEQKDGVRFLKEEASRKRRMSDEINQLLLADGVLSIGKFNSPFPFPVWREMLDVINPVSVTLDVETANPWLELSEDLKSLRRARTQRSLPDTRKRFTDWECALGSGGFTSGRHYWEVEVTGNRGWSLGVAAESVERKDPVRLSPETGSWTIGRVVDQFDINSSPGSRLRVGQIPGKVGVYLSYESGTVSFYNVDTKSHLHTFTGNKFTEKLYPFFWTRDVNQFLRICSGSDPDWERGGASGW